MQKKRNNVQPLKIMTSFPSIICLPFSRREENVSLFPFLVFFQLFPKKNLENAFQARKGNIEINHLVLLHPSSCTPQTCDVTSPPPPPPPRLSWLWLQGAAATFAAAAASAAAANVAYVVRYRRREIITSPIFFLLLVVHSGTFSWAGGGE